MYNVIYIYIIYMHNFQCHSKMMLTTILKSVFYNPFQNGVHFDFFQPCIYVQSAQSENFF